MLLDIPTTVRKLSVVAFIAHPLNTASLVNEVAWLLSRTPLPTGLGGMTAEHRHPRVKEGTHLNTTVGKVLLEDLAYEYGVTDWVRLETGGSNNRPDGIFQVTGLGAC